MENNKEYDGKQIFYQIVRQEYSAKFYQIIKQIRKVMKEMGEEEPRIDDVFIALNNKAGELGIIFKNAGVPLFGQMTEDANFKSSLIGDAVIHDLRGKSTSAVGSIFKYGEQLNEIVSRKSTANNSLENTNVFKRLVSRLASGLYSFFIEPFVPVKPASSFLTEEERSSLQKLIEEYNDGVEGVFNYKLEENLVLAIVQEFTTPRKLGDIDLGPLYDLRIDPTLLERKVIPDLQALGMADLLPILREQLEKKGLIGDIEMASQEGDLTINRGTGIGKNAEGGR